MARLPVVPESTDSEVVTGIIGSIHARNVDVPNLYLTIANAPRMLQAWIDLTWPLRNEGTSPRSLRELVIMCVARVEQAPYVWAHHWDMAIAAGITAEQLDSIGNWQSAELFDPNQAAVLAYTEEVVGESGVSDGTFEEIRKLFSPGEIVELTLAATFYMNLAHLARALQIDLEPKYVEYARRLPA